jgi:hypothetical protein
MMTSSVKIAANPWIALNAPSMISMSPANQIQPTHPVTLVDSGVLIDPPNLVDPHLGSRYNTACLLRPVRHAYWVKFRHMRHPLIEGPDTFAREPLAHTSAAQPGRSSPHSTSEIRALVTHWWGGR